MTPELPYRAVFVTAETAHGPDCTGCEEAAKKAASLARSIGSVGGRYSDNGHAARVHRMGWVGR